MGEQNVLSQPMPTVCHMPILKYQSYIYKSCVSYDCEDINDKGYERITKNYFVKACCVSQT